MEKEKTTLTKREEEESCEMNNADVCFFSMLGLMAADNPSCRRQVLIIKLPLLQLS